MAQWTATGIRIAGISSAVPERTLGVDDIRDRFGAEQAAKIVESVGVQTRRVVTNNTCTSDLCFAAAQKLLAELEWNPNSIDALIYVTQTPDYILPATACSLHGRLGLGKQCLSFDVNLGCSGYVYGLGLASRLVGAGNIKRGLLLVGDTASRIVCEDDRSAAPLFGDAGTATAIEFDEAAPEMTFDMGTDGNGAEHLVIPAGAFREPHTFKSSVPTERENGNVRSDEHLYMNGGEVFMFTLAEVPGLVKRTMSAAGWTIDSTDAVILHQANAFMLSHLRKRMKIPEDKLTLALSDYGNTSSASIPLAITHCWAESGLSRAMKFLLGGFGVGWSWAGAAVTCDQDIVLPKLVIVPDATQYVGPVARTIAEAA